MDYVMSQIKGNKSGYSVSPSISVKGKSVLYTTNERLSKSPTVEKTVTTDLNKVIPQKK